MSASSYLDVSLIHVCLGKCLYPFPGTSVSCLVPEQKNKIFRLQLGSGTDVVSMDRLKPVFSDEPVSVALHPAHGRPVLRASVPVLSHPELLALPSAAPPASGQEGLFPAASFCSCLVKSTSGGLR